MCYSSDDRTIQAPTGYYLRLSGRRMPDGRKDYARIPDGHPQAGLRMIYPPTEAQAAILATINAGNLTASLRPVYNSAPTDLTVVEPRALTMHDCGQADTPVVAGATMNEFGLTTQEAEDMVRPTTAEGARQKWGASACYVMLTAALTDTGTNQRTPLVDDNGNTRYFPNGVVAADYLQTGGYYPNFCSIHLV